LFRLYGLVREDDGGPPVQVVFVGQDGEGGRGDHYLPGDRAPSTVAAHVASLVAAERAHEAGAQLTPSGPAAAINGRAADAVVSAPADLDSGAEAPAHPSGDETAQALAAPATPAEIAETAAVPSRPPGRHLDVTLVRAGP